MSLYNCEPVILADFTCIADKCPDSCCSAPWDIKVDDATIARWKAMPDVKETKALLVSIESYEDDGKTYSRFKKNSDGHCYHMQESGHCSIHSNNENSLQPDVCHTFPRMNLDNGFMQVNTLHLSCPEVVRLVLESPASRVLELSKPLRRWLQQGQDKEGDFSSPEAYMQRMLYLLWEKKQYSYSVRTTFLAKLLIYIVESANEVAIDATFFEDIYANMGPLLQDFNKDVLAGDVAPASKPSASIWHSCFLLLQDEMPGLISEGSQFSKIAAVNNSQADFYNLVMETKETHKTQWDEIAPLLERYLEISFMNKSFPAKPYWGNYIASFLNVIIPLYCIEMGLCILLEQHGKITNQDLINTIYRVERKVQDNLIYSQLTDTPDMLRIDQYFISFLEL